MALATVKNPIATFLRIEAFWGGQLWWLQID